jgi:hypothetical protein
MHDLAVDGEGNLDMQWTRNNAPISAEVLGARVWKRHPEGELLWTIPRCASNARCARHAAA